jgi:hypothetical protein
MFQKMAESQSDLVNALLDEIDGADWTRAYVHAEFGEEGGLMPQLRQGFLVVPGDAGPARVSLLLDAPVGAALDAMHRVYAEAGQGFRRLDLVVQGDSRYRFELDDTPSLLLAGQPDPEARARMDRRFDELSAP